MFAFLFDIDSKLQYNFCMDRVTCDKCCGDGKQFGDVADDFKMWRTDLGLNQTQVCEAVGISDKTQLSRFENNRFIFSEQRLRALERFYLQEQKTK